jgi:UDP-GlcNAc:undecaprenyl-phosphate/decaprenyl-phosphate GlcNAc-1-phosphate transferase
MIVPALSFVLAALLALYTTPLMRAAALKFGIVDRPDGKLKHQKEPVPYLGGLAVYLAFLIALGVAFEFSHEVLAILLAGTLMVLVGLIDDLGVLSPWEKLAGQAIAVAVIVKAGLYVKLIFVPTVFALGLSVLWLLVVTNAINIVDIMDGLASGIAALAAAFLAIIAVLNGKPTVATMAAALSGSLCGFLRFNSAPAKIYLGDSGSLFIGMTLAALAMNGHYTVENWVAMLTPPIILGVPLFDLAFVSLVRLEKGLSPFRGSPDHFAIRLRQAGFSVQSTVGIAYAAAFGLGIAGLAIMCADDEQAAGTILAALSASVLATGLALRMLRE